jgi:hypothetical protein
LLSYAERATVNDEPNLFTVIWSGLLSFGGLVLAWLHLAQRTETSDMKAQSAKALGKAESVEQSLAAHKLHAAETFVTKSSVERGFDKLDERLEKMDEALDEIKNRLPPKQH